MSKITLHDFITEMQTWVTFTPEELERAKAANMPVTSNKTLRQLFKDWANGVYDEDPQTLGQELKNLIPN